MKIDEIEEIARQKRREHRMEIDRIKKSTRQWHHDRHKYSKESDDERIYYSRV